jgi:hypothetical protein
MAVGKGFEPLEGLRSPTLLESVIHCPPPVDTVREQASGTRADA